MNGVKKLTCIFTALLVALTLLAPFSVLATPLARAPVVGDTFSEGEFVYSVKSAAVWDATARRYNPGAVVVTGHVTGATVETINLVSSTTNAIVNGRLTRPNDGTTVPDPNNPDAPGKFYGETYNIVEIGNSVFTGNLSVKNVSLPHTVTKIGDDAFAECPQLTNVVVATDKNVYKLLEVGARAFQNCKKLTNFDGFKAQLTSLGASAFYGCEVLPGADLSKTKLTEIKDETFKNCFAMTSMALPLGIEVIGKSAFEECRNLQSALLKGAVNLTTIGDFAFRNSEKVREINIGPKVNSIGDEAFYGMKFLANIFVDGSNSKYISHPGAAGQNMQNSSLYEAEVDANGALVPGGSRYYKLMLFAAAKSGSYTVHPETVIIDKHAFMNSNLNLVNLESAGTTSKLEEIRQGAFKNARLATINIPASVKIIAEPTEMKDEMGNLTGDFNDDGAFAGCKELLTLGVETGNTVYESIRIDDSAAVGTAPMALASKKNASGLQTIYVYPAKAPVTKYTVPKSVNGIAPYAFANTRNLSELYTETGLDKVGSHAFEGSERLTRVQLSDTVTHIGRKAFINCALLNTVTIGKQFAQPDKLTEEMFSGSLNLQKIEIAPENGVYASIDGVVYSRILDRLYYYPPAKKNEGDVDTYVTPTQVRYIHDRAFYKQANLQKVEFKANVENLGKEAMHSNSKLSMVIFRRVVGRIGTTVDDLAFEECPALGNNSVYVPYMPYFDDASLKNVHPNRVVRMEQLDSISLDKQEITMSVSQELWLLLNVKPKEAQVYYPAEWKSEDPNVATVNQDGKIVAVSPGQTTISAIMYDAEEQKLMSQCKVKVIYQQFDDPVSKLKFEVTKLPDATGQGGEVMIVGFATGTNSVSVLTIPSTVNYNNLVYSITKVGNYAFAKKPITEINFSGKSNIRVIGDGAFSEITGIKSVKIPASVEEICYGAFKDCSSLAIVIFEGTKAPIIRPLAFDGCAKNLQIIAPGDNYFPPESEETLPPGSKPTTKKVTLDKTTVTLTIGATQKVVATANWNPALTATWTSSNPMVATVSNDGTIKSVKEGKCNITASIDGYTAQCTVYTGDAVLIIEPKTVELGIGATVRLKATASWDPLAKVKWTTSNDKIATVDDTGIVRAVGEGKTDIVASFEGKTAFCSVTVSKKQFTIDKAEVTLIEGQSVVLTPKANWELTDLVWASDKPLIAKVDKTGKVTAVSEGTATITAYSNGIYVYCAVTVTGSELKLNYYEGNLYQTRSFMLKPENNFGGKEYEFKSSNKKIATVTSEGKVTGVSPGKVTITVTCEGRKAQCNLVIKKIIPVKSLKVVGKYRVTPIGKDTEYFVLYSPKNASSVNVKWETSDPTIATVTQSGTVKGVKEGYFYLTVTAGNKKVRYKLLSGREAKTVLMSQESASVTAGKSKQLAAKPDKDAAYREVRWASSNTNYATVDETGLVTTYSKGKGKTVKIYAVAADMYGATGVCTIKIK